MIAMLEFFCSKEFLATILGGALAIVASYLATKEAHKLNIKQQENLFNQEIEALIASIKSELICLKELYDNEYGKQLKDLPTGEYMMGGYVISQNYFIIFDQNCNKIGQIKDTSLSNQIIKTYITAKQFVDVAKSYQEIFASYEKYEREGKLDYSVILNKISEQLKNLSFKSSALTYQISWCKANSEASNLHEFELEIVDNNCSLLKSQYQKLFAKQQEKALHTNQVLKPVIEDLISYTHDNLITMHKRVEDSFLLVFQEFERYEKLKTSNKVLSRTKGLSHNDSL